MGSELVEKEKRAIECMRMFERKDEPYYLCYSGGKDSDVIRILAELAGVNYEIHNNHTTVDTPNTVYYIRKQLEKYGSRTYDRETRTIKFGDKAFIHMPEMSMWQLIVKKQIPPTRLARYCCMELKEKGGRGRRKITGVRWEESNNRKNNQGLVTIVGQQKRTEKIAKEVDANFRKTKKGGIILNTDNDAERRVVESCYRTTSTMINPIIDWTENDVWSFLKYYGCASNPEYQCGEKRVGCIGCPLAGGKKQKEEFKRFPKYRAAYVRTFDKMLEERRKAGKTSFDIAKGWTWRDGEAVMRWWVGDDPLQITIDDYMKFLEEGDETLDEYAPPYVYPE